MDQDQDTNGAKDIILSQWKKHGSFHDFVKMIQCSPFIASKPQLILQFMKMEGLRIMIECRENENRIPIDDGPALLSCIQDILNDDEEPQTMVAKKEESGSCENIESDLSKDIKLPPPPLLTTSPDKVPSPPLLLQVHSRVRIAKPRAAKRKAAVVKNNRGSPTTTKTSQFTIEASEFEITSVPLDKLDLDQGPAKRGKSTQHPHKSVPLRPSKEMEEQICQLVLINALNGYIPPEKEAEPRSCFSSPPKRNKLPAQLTQVARTPLSKTARASRRRATRSSSKTMMPLVAPPPGILKAATACFFAQNASKSVQQQAVCRVSFELPHELDQMKQPRLFSPVRKVHVVPPPPLLFKEPPGDVLSLKRTFGVGLATSSSSLSLSRIISPDAPTKEVVGLEVTDENVPSIPLDDDTVMSFPLPVITAAKTETNERFKGKIGDTAQLESTNASVTGISRRPRGKQLNIITEILTRYNKSSDSKAVEKTCITVAAHGEASSQPREKRLNMTTRESMKAVPSTAGTQHTMASELPKMAANHTSRPRRGKQLLEISNRELTSTDSTEARSKTTASTELEQQKVAQRQDEVGSARRSKRLKAAAENNSRFVDGPFSTYSHVDVLFYGTFDSSTQNHHGNVKFLGYLLHFLDHFDKLHPTDRRSVASLLVAHYIFHDPRVRFLTKIDPTSSEQMTPGLYLLSFDEATNRASKVLDKIRLERRRSNYDKKARSHCSDVYDSQKRAVLRRLLLENNQSKGESDDSVTGGCI